MTIARTGFSLRHRITIGLLLYAAALTAMLLTAGLVLGEHRERLVWQALLADVMGRDLHAVGQASDQPAIAPARLFDLDSPAAQTLPAAVRALGPGLHCDIERGDLPYAVLVREIGGRRMAAVVDISAQQAQEQQLTHIVVVIVAIGLALLLLTTWWLAGRLLAPVSELIRSVNALDPLQRQSRVATPFRQHEIAALQTAFNRFLERVDGFVVREREFIDTVSHELRTPIAVVGGAAQLLGHEQLTVQGVQALARIRGSASTMQETIAALLYLAKDPVAFVPVEPWRLDTWLPELAHDHAHLIGDKPLRIDLGALQTTRTRVPPTLAAMVIGNLVRNAIEHTASGTLHIAVENRVLTVASRGAELDVDAISRLYRAVATADSERAPGAGIGLHLISRLCDRLGWTLTFENEPNGDVQAQLQMPPDGSFC